MGLGNSVHAIIDIARYLLHIFGAATDKLVGITIYFNSDAYALRCIHNNALL
ncbi:hypothetical protein D3C80_2104660 [compost metagenome]